MGSNITDITTAKKKKEKKEIIDPQALEAAQYFIPLGHSDNRLYFMTTRGKRILDYSPSNLSNKANLFMLAPLGWWERQYNTDGGFKGETVDNAISWLIALCYDEGSFTLKNVRGRGAWWDADRAVLHLGDHLLVDNERVELLEMESEYVYEAGPAMDVDLTKQATDEEALQLVDICKALHWRNPIYGPLAAGWVVTAVVCGALSWRPHAITTGPQGCGKSWVVEHIYHHVLGDFVLSAKGETSEAGLRQELKHDSLPVTFDEAEATGPKAAENLNKVLGLMRQASAEVKGHILKGGADGIAAKYTIRSAFHLLAIGVPLQQTSDENRVTVLTLCANSREQQDNFKATTWPLVKQLETTDWAARIRARVFANIKTLRHNAAEFTRAMSNIFSARVGDQYGPLLGGVWLLGTTKPITTDEAVAKVKELNYLFDDVRNVQEESDESKLIDTISAQQIRVEADGTPGTRELTRTIGEVIQVASNQLVDSIQPEVANACLTRHGLKVAGEFVIIANRHEGLTKLMAKSAWAVGWGHILQRIDGSEVCPGKVRFAGIRCRAVSVPLEEFI